jgi:transketolase
MKTDDLLKSGLNCTHETEQFRPSRHTLANAIRALAMDAVQKANSGHPGMPMGMADIAEVLWNDFLVHNPANPNWINRDRFILSNGHGAMLHYALLHLSGYDLSLHDLKQFRQLHSKTPGHPEFGYTPGVETTTGPLGQGIANAVGMAIAEKKLAAQFNKPSQTLIDHYTYVFVGDGCLMEGISHEVCSLAGTLGLGKLIAFYDDNGISIDGEVVGWFRDDTPARFKAYGWHVVADVDGHDAQAIKAAIVEARSITDKPSIICCKTVIGYGAPNAQGTADVHGAPLGDQEIAAAREKLGWHHGPFEIPQNIYDQWDAKAKGELTQQAWNQTFAAYEADHPALAKEFKRRITGALPSNWQSESQAFIQKLKNAPQEMATRKASKLCLDAYGPLLPELLGGSADLTGSNLTLWNGATALTKESPAGDYLYYGVREFGMFAIMNGIALHSGFVPYAGTFLTFVDYGKNAVRLSALMKAHVIYVLTHDSIGLGEDGPTHQPIEHAAMLRLIPGLNVWRPADAVETAVAWKFSIEHKKPACLLLTRQNVPANEHASSDEIHRGGYILIDSEKTPELIFIATGSEVSLVCLAAKQLKTEGVAVRVVSMPCLEVFEEQEQQYQEKVLPKHITRRVIVEAGSTSGWYKYASQGQVMGIDRFGESAPYKEVYQELGLTTEHIIKVAKSLF